MTIWFSAPAPPAVHVETDERSADVLVGATYDVGKRGSSYGIELLHGWEHWQGMDGLGGGTLLSTGLDARLITRSHDDVDAFALEVPLRFDFMADTGGVGFEVDLGVGHGEGATHGVGAVGVYYGVMFFEIGYSYQFPLGPFDRPDWMASHQFSIRLKVPVKRYDRRKTVSARVNQ